MGVLQRLFTSDAAADDTEFRRDFETIRAHVLRRIQSADIGQAPFYHTFIENIFPSDYFEGLRSHMLTYKGTAVMQARRQDNPAYVNRRYNLVDDETPVVRQLLGLFESPDIKRALFAKFYSAPGEHL